MDIVLILMNWARTHDYFKIYNDISRYIDLPHLPPCNRSASGDRPRGDHRLEGAAGGLAHAEVVGFQQHQV